MTYDSENGNNLCDGMSVEKPAVEVKDRFNRVRD